MDQGEETPVLNREGTPTHRVPWSRFPRLRPYASEPRLSWISSPISSRALSSRGQKLIVCWRKDNSNNK